MRKANQPRTILRLLHTAGLAPLSRRARQFAPAAQTAGGGNADREPSPADLRELLPEALRGHVWPVREGEKLVLVAENSSVAQLLRFHGPRMARRLNVERWEVHVAPLPAGGQHPPQQRPPQRLPAAAARSLRQTAAAIADPELRDALERLARNADS